MLPDVNLYSVNAYHQEKIREANTQRLVKTALMASRSSMKRHNLLLTALGARMVQLGSRLQAKNHAPVSLKTQCADNMA